MMNQVNRQKVANKVAELFANGNTPLKEYGINGDLIVAVEKEHPHVSKQYPWQPNPAHKVA